MKIAPDILASLRSRIIIPARVGYPSLHTAGDFPPRVSGGVATQHVTLSFPMALTGIVARPRCWCA